MPFGPTHDLIKTLSTWTLDAFFQSITSTNANVVPKAGPLIVASTHWNMIMDPALLSTRLTHGRKLHYWSKNTLFKNPIIKFILIDSGNIPVDRTTKNNQLLFKGTFDVLKLGEAVALFPEGTSYTQPRIMQIKDGIGWTALEYAKNLRLTGNSLSGSPETAAGLTTVPGPPAQDVTIVIVGLNYTEKDAYRSSVQLEYAQPITLSADLVVKFMSEGEGEAKVAVKELVGELERRLRSVTVNAPDWPTLWCVKIVREMIWADGHGPMETYRDSMQRLINLLALDSAHSSPALTSLHADLLAYHDQLKAAHTTHRIFAQAFRSSATGLLAARLTAVAEICMRWPFFFVPAIAHLPIYAGSYLGSRLQPLEPESMAQNMAAVGMFAGLASVPVYVCLLSSLLLKGSDRSLLARVLAWALSLGFLLVLRAIHDRLVDGFYDAYKRLKLVLRLDQDKLEVLKACRQKCEEGWDQVLTADQEDLVKVLRSRGGRFEGGGGGVRLKKD
ncbi:hypothetical protein CROQUDRAFT_272796 [Cronartium quercuum f. sp. fusiforme G11]|uniref:Phospholipid/glycerol acyltransferase domain-containing protein n=1 Tax=Cronartium quercuum f. sp. fusiforme G11 TaxID=708437 RepID=A0A9P6NCI6_9BASI|nr:hypothetical protein CROQUDRAFT_272796 [Cronartium quercuum f. sp. fusiforme G11]